MRAWARIAAVEIAIRQNFKPALFVSTDPILPDNRLAQVKINKKDHYFE